MVLISQDAMLADSSKSEDESVKDEALLHQSSSTTATMSEQPATSTTQAQSPARDTLFNQLSEETDLQLILKTFGDLCSEIGLDPAQHEGFYQAFKSSFTSWKAGALFQLLDERARQAEYDSQRACAGKRVLVIGAGPVGLRAAIEAAFLGASVDVVEKRDSFTRNNSLHLWPFLITDLKNLGAKKFYGRFCSSTIDHICIRILQSILLRVCLILGIKVHVGVTFKKLIEPANANSGWTILTTPTTSPITGVQYDMIIGADGKQNSLPGFIAKEFRAKLALAITVNYKNTFSKQESAVPEISGVAYVYRQNFFNDLADKHGIELENIVYYKDETHYFVMTAKKGSLLRKNVLKKDHNDPAALLHRDNIDRKSLETYANEAVGYATENALGPLPFERNHRGENDVALFDFTSLFASENAARIVERKGKRILLCVVGDSLIEPFWPTGSGCARGFLGAFDAAWLMKRFCKGDDPLEILEERESILYLLPQTTPERLQKNHSAYSIDPKTRYTNLSELIPPGDISHLYDTDDSNALALSRNQSMARSSTRRSTRGSSPVAVQPSQPVSSTKPVTTTPKSGESQKIDDKEAIITGEKKQEKVRQFWKKQHGSSSSTSAKAEKHPKSKPVEPVAPASDSHKKKHKSASPMPAHETSSPKVQKKKAEDTVSPKKQAASSPKWFHFRGKSHNQRSKSESPERQVKKSRDDKEKVEHQLEVVASSESPKLAAKDTVVLEESPANVLDRIKQYNINDAAVMKDRTGAKAATTSQSTKGDPKAASKDDKVKPKEDTKAKSKEKIKEKDKTKKKDDDRKKASKKTSKKEASSSSWNPFKKSHKVQSDAKGKKAKKAKDDSKPTQQPPSGDGSQVEFSGVKNRIEKLKELGLETDGTDSDGVVLLSVVQHEEEGEGGELKIMLDENEESEDEESDSSESSEDEVDGEGEKEESDINEEGEKTEGEIDKEEEKEETKTDTRTEVRLPSPEIVISPSPESSIPSPEPTAASVESLNTSVTDKLKTLQRSPAPIKRTRSYTDSKKSKEIDLSELSQNTQKPHESHPLWKARVIQGMNKCLEAIRKGNDIKEAKTTLEILNAIFSNVEKYPDNDVFRRVRVSSPEFTSKVWQYSAAGQFLARSGWVQIGDVIVLPMGTPVDTPKRVLEKHLNIINQMLWSMQLEIPDSPGEVVRRKKTKKTKVRGRVFSLTRRESYATRLVEESMERISEEEEVRAMAAARVRRKSAENVAVEELRRSSLTDDQGKSGDEGGLKMVVEGNEEEEETEEERTEVEQKGSKTPARQLEEASIKGATEARKKWEARSDSYKENLETELYGLTPSKLAESIASKPKYARSSYRRSTAAGIEERIRLLSTSAENSLKKVLAAKAAKIAEAGEDGVDICGPIAGRDSSSVSPDMTAEHESPLHSKASTEASRSGSTSPISSAPAVQVREDTTKIMAPPPQTPSDGPLQKDSTSLKAPDEPESGGGKNVTRAQSPPTAAVDQLKLLTAVSRGSGVEKREEVCAVKSERLHYEKISIEAAAITREKWKQTEEKKSNQN